MLTDYGPDVVADTDDGPIFWLALAATQWNLGRLEESVKERALQSVESGVNLRKWEEEAAPNEAKRRADALAKLKAQLLSPLPPAKKVKERYKQETEFEPGDVWRYRLLSGRSVLFLVTRLQSDKGGRYPIMTILDAEGDMPVDRVHLARAGVRRPLKTWVASRFAVARWSKTDYPQGRLKRLLAGLPVPSTSSPRQEPWSVYHWKHLDKVLLEDFGLE